MLGNYITIDGVSSRSLGLFCKQLPMFPVAVQSFNTFTVGGRLDTLYQYANHYSDIQLDIEAVLIGFEVDPIIRWVSSGKKIVLSNQPDRYAVIRQLVAVDQKRAGNGALEIKITVKCSPFKYKIANDTIEIAPSPRQIRTSGTIFSEPLIVMKNVSSDCYISVNSVQFEAYDLTGDVYIDVPNRVAYQIVSNVKTVVLDHTSGRIWDLLLVPSETEYNAISYTGCDKLLITPNERWL